MIARIGRASSAILTAITTLESQAREYETKAGVCRDAAQQLREAFGVSTLGPTTSTSPPPAAPVELPRPAPTPVVRHVPEEMVEDPMRIGQPAAHRRTAPRRVKTAPAVPGWTTYNLSEEPSRQALSSAVLRILEQAGEPMRSGVILRTLRGSNGDQLRVILADLERLQLVVRTGVKSATVYAAVPAPGPVLPTPSTLGPEAAPMALNPGKVGFFLLNGVFTHDRPIATGDVVLAVHDKFGKAPFDELEPLLTELVTAGVLRTLRHDDEFCYQRAAAAVKSKDTSPVLGDPKLIGEIMRVLASGASYDARDILRNTRAAFPALTAEMLEPVLEQLHRDRRVDRIAVGSTRRYRKIATQSKRTA